MTLPQVIITELDNALGVVPPSAGRLTVFLGCCDSGPLNTPAAYARIPDLKATFTGGPNVEAAAYYIAQTGRPVVFVRADAAVPGTVSAVVQTGTGTCVVTVDPDADTPTDDYQYIIRIVKPGTIAAAGITYQLSYDGGYNWDPETPLGVATTIATNTGVSFMLAAGDCVAGDIYTATATGPGFDVPALKLALDGLALSSIAWEQLAVSGPVMGTAVGELDAFINTARSRGRYRSWIATARMPAPTETQAAYQTALQTSFGSYETRHGGVTAAATRLTSAVTGRYYRRPLLFGFMALQGNVSEEVNTADVNLGPIPGASLTDRNGNPIEHDESLNPGLDDMRFITARTWDGYAGVYITRPRLLSNASSDFQIIPYRRVINLAEDALRQYFIRRLNRPVRVDPKTGYILESSALEIEGGALATMRSVLMAKPKASDVQFRLSRTDNLLSTKTMTGTARVIPLAYPEFIEIEVGFYNPALSFAAAA